MPMATTMPLLPLITDDADDDEHIALRTAFPSESANSRVQLLNTGHSTSCFSCDHKTK